MSKDDLIIFLAHCVSKMADARLSALACKDLESMRKIIALSYPVVQGLECQMQIDKIAEGTFDGQKAWDQGQMFLAERTR